MIGSSTPTIDRADPHEAVVDICYEDLLRLANDSGALCDGILNDTALDGATVNGTLLDVGAGGLNNWWAMLALVLVLGTAAGNILVCLAITKERRLQNVTNYFLMSLAITDLMVAVLVMPLGILTLVRGKCFAA
ncbi:5-hydroxytryptamine receptor 2A [Eufriesea mexicana]|uniref:5-hydroxytryptamine receptor 2A n=1 Tax=Eufriesea mexicana TaxID=516756 RepID=A0A310S4Y4_9HYME|nr:5-hydroxytryptamine receptor 2A [Eufriesea mexicana]